MLAITLWWIVSIGACRILCFLPFICWFWWYSPHLKLSVLESFPSDRRYVQLSAHSHPLSGLSVAAAHTKANWQMNCRSLQCHLEPLLVVQPVVLSICESICHVSNEKLVLNMLNLTEWNCWTAEHANVLVFFTFYSRSKQNQFLASSLISYLVFCEVFHVNTWKCLSRLILWRWLFPVDEFFSPQPHIVVQSQLNILTFDTNQWCDLPLLLRECVIS